MWDLEWPNWTEEEPEREEGRDGKGKAPTCIHLSHSPTPIPAGQKVGGCKLGLSGWPIRCQVRDFGSQHHPCPVCEHVCCVLGPLSCNVTIGGHPWVPDSGLTRLILPCLHTPSRSARSPAPFPSQPSARRGVPGSVQRALLGKLSKAGRGPRCAPVPEASIGWDCTTPAGRRPPGPPSVSSSRARLRHSPGPPGLETPARSAAQKVDSLIT